MHASPAPGIGSRSEGNNARPFFYTHLTAQPPFPNPWYLNPIYSPYCVSATGFRNGNPYIPYYSVALHEYPGYLMPQTPVPTRMNRRPYFNPQPSFPMFQQTARFCHYSNPGKKTETKETQTDPQQPESKSKKRQDLQLDTDGCNMGSRTDKMTNIASEKPDIAFCSLVQERELHGKSPSATTVYRSIPSGSYALEKEEVRIEYEDGSPAVHLWKSFKETIPIYDLTNGKTVPENIVQCDLFSVSSCERMGVLYTPHKGEEMTTIEYPEDEKACAILTKQSLEAVRDKEIQMLGPSLEGSLNKKKDKVSTQKCSSPIDTANQWQSDELNRAIKKVHSITSPNLSVSGTPKTSTQELNHHEGSGCTSIETINGLSQVPPSPNRHNGQTKLRDNFWNNQLGELIPSPTWLACFEKVDASIHPLPQRKSPSITSLEPYSTGEESSLDNMPMTEFVLEKSLYAKSTEGTEQETEIQDDHNNEEEVEVMSEVDDVIRDAKESSSVKFKEPIKKDREQEALPKCPTQKPCLLKKKREYVSDPDSEDLWRVEEEDDDDDVDYHKDVDEVEYIFEAVDPKGDLTPTNEGLYQQIGQQVMWKPPLKSPQLIVWPVKNKNKTKIGAYESTAIFHKLKDSDCYETIYGKLMKRRIVAKRGEPPISERHFQSRVKKEALMVVEDDFWVKSGAKPKFTSQNMNSMIRSKEKVKFDRSKRKLLHRYKDMRPEAETVEVWKVPKCSIHRGYKLRRFSHRK